MPAATTSGLRVLYQSLSKSGCGFRQYFDGSLRNSNAMASEFQDEL